MIDQNNALEIAKNKVAGTMGDFKIVHGIPKDLNLYGASDLSGDDVWCVFCPSGTPHLGGGRVIVIDQTTGNILADQMVGE